MIQPLVYNDTEEDKQKLINWLKDNLKEQRELISKEKGIDKSEVKDEELTLNIGHQNQKIIINFDFNFWKIFSDLLEKQTDKYNCPYKVNCMNVIFQGKVNLGTFISNGIPYFGAFTFEGNVNFSSATFACSVSFERATFKNKANFGITVLEHKNKKPHTIFWKDITFERAVFNDEADFKHVVFNETANFTFTIFNGEADFKYVKVKKNIIFNNTSLYERGAFWEIEIDNETLTFDNIKLSDKSNIYFGGVVNTETRIKIKNTVVSGRIDFNDLEIKEIDFEKSIVVGNGVVTRIRFETECNNSQTARLLKHEAYKISNVIEGLKYKAIEKDLYKEELKKTPDFLKDLKKLFITFISYKDKLYSPLYKLLKCIFFYYLYPFYKCLKHKFCNIAEISSIALSKLSNNHGQDWFRAVAFTLISGLFFFTLSTNPIITTKFLYLILFIPLIAFLHQGIFRYIFNVFLACSIFASFVFIHPLIIIPLLVFIIYLMSENIIKYPENKITKYSSLLCFLLLLFIIVFNNKDFYIDNFFAYLIPTNFDGIIPNKSQNFINTFFMSGKKINTTYSLFQSLDGIKKIFSYTTYFMGKIAIGYGMVEIVQAFRKLNSK